MTRRMLTSVFLAAACWAVVTHLEDLARYLRMRNMSNPPRR